MANPLLELNDLAPKSSDVLSLEETVSPEEGTAILVNPPPLTATPLPPPPLTIPLPPSQPLLVDGKTQVPLKDQKQEEKGKEKIEIELGFKQASYFLRRKRKREYWEKQKKEKGKEYIPIVDLRSRKKRANK
jgi:hypothetical protein